MKTKLIDTLNRFYRVLNSHIGSNGDAHGTADKYNHGFMSKEDKAVFDRVSKTRVWLPDNTDILTLEPGYYEGVNLVNSPLPSNDNGWLEIDVTLSVWQNTTRKQYTAIKSITGDMWIRTVHTEGTPTSGSNGWRYVLTSTKMLGNTLQQQRINLGLNQSSPLSILNLDAGMYEGCYFSDAPFPSTDGAWTIIDVTYGQPDTTTGKSRKQYKITKSFSGESWIRTTHTDGTPTSGSNGWRKFAYALGSKITIPIAAINTATTYHVDLTGYRLTDIPIPHLTPVTATPQNVRVSVNNVTLSGFDIIGYRTDAGTPFDCYWEAH